MGGKMGKKEAYVCVRVYLCMHNTYLLRRTESPTAPTLPLIGHARGGLALPVHVRGACRQRGSRREWRTSQARGTIASPFFILHGGGGVRRRELGGDAVTDAFAVACSYYFNLDEKEEYV